jgi:hypothetical protein
MSYDVYVEAQVSAAIAVKAVPLAENGPVQKAAGSVCSDDDRVQSMRGAVGSVAGARRLCQHRNI